jgi:hypothetical protein
MEYVQATAPLAASVTAAAQQGPGSLLRIVLLVLLVGVGLTVFLLLRAYRDTGEAGEPAPAPRAEDRS